MSFLGMLGLANDEEQQGQGQSQGLSAEEEFPIGETLDISTGGEDDSSNKNSSISRVPITDRDEAMEFAKTEWNKIRRGSGHSLEVQVFGSNHWKVGEWCKVYLPTLNEYTDMYITKIDNSNDSGSEWLTSLTLMDYAPSLSEIDEESVKSQSEEEGEGVENDDGESGASGGESSQWTEIVKILEANYEKPSGGWNSIIQAIRDAKKYEPDIKNQITPLKQKSGKSYVDVGHDLCDVVGITY